MRFKIDKIPYAHRNLEIDTSWQAAPTLGEMRIQSLGLAVSCVGMLLVGVIVQGQFIPKGLLVTLSILLLTVPVHELLHALSTPEWGLSPKTIFGFRQYRGLWTPYVSFEGDQPFWRFLLTGLAPTIFLTCLPLILVVSFPLADPYRAWLGFLAFFNIAISGGDLVLVFWFLKSLPWRTEIRQMDWKLYWKATNPAH